MQCTHLHCLNVFFPWLPCAAMPAGPVREFAAGRMNALRWPAVHLKEAPAPALFPPGDIVMLSPDAQAPLLELDPSKVHQWGVLGAGCLRLCAFKG
jgi:hypothetical protein